MRGRDLSASELLRRYGGRARKRFGQNFLMQQHTLDKIVDLARLTPSDRVIEVGPGPGALTATILRREVPLTAVELDRDLAEHLRATFGDDPGFTLVEEDALKVDWSALLSEPGAKVIANLPYNIATPVLLRMIDQRNPPSRLVLMFQREVADRICAEVGTRESGWLTLATISRFRAHVALRVPPGAFVPAPKVHSAVVVFQKRDEPLFSLEDEEVLRALAERAFTQRRKTLRNNLKGFRTADEIDAAGVNPQLRAEALTIEQWRALLNSLDAPARKTLIENSRSRMGVL